MRDKKKKKKERGGLDQKKGGENTPISPHLDPRLIAIRDRRRGKILGKMEISRPLHGKARILWQLENLQNYKDLYGKLLERAWSPKRLLLIQILLISNVHKNSPLKDINPKICI